MENDLEACTLILENRLDNMQQKCALHIWEGGGPNGQKETILCLNVLVLPKNVNFISLAAVCYQDHCNPQNMNPELDHVFHTHAHTYIHRLQYHIH